MSNYVLMHGTFVELSDEELMHWKYIKREKRPDGSYRYYYKDDEYDEISKKYSDARQKAENARQVSRSYRQFVSYYQNQLDKKNNGNLNATDRNENLKNWKKMSAKAADEHTAASQKAQQIKKQYDKATKAYNKSAGHKVADFLSKSSNVINKAKKWFKGLFS